MKFLLSNINSQNISRLIVVQFSTDHVERVIAQLDRFENQNVLSD